MTALRNNQSVKEQQEFYKIDNLYLYMTNCSELENRRLYNELSEGARSRYLTYCKRLKNTQQTDSGTSDNKKSLKPYQLVKFFLINGVFGDIHYSSSLDNTIASALLQLKKAGKIPQSKKIKTERLLAIQTSTEHRVDEIVKVTIVNN